MRFRRLLFRIAGRAVPFGLVMLPPLFVLAQSLPGHQGLGLTPCGVVPGSNYLIASQCGLCDLGQLIQNIINFLIVLALPISAALFAWAGILLFTAGDNTGAREKAKKILKDVVIGLLIALSGYLVVQTALVTLLNPNFLSGGLSWNTLQCASDDATNSRPRNASVTQLFTGLSTGGGGSSGTLSSVAPPPSGGGTNGSVDAIVPQMCQLESGCGQNVDNGSATGCNSYGACGPMQILPSTACGTNPGFSSGCNANGTVGNQTQVAQDLQSVQNSQALATQILTTAQNSSQCNGSLSCAVALYAQGAAALQPSACCSSGAAYQCAYDCGTTVAGSYQCDTNPGPSCVATKGSAYSYIKKLNIQG